MTQEPPPPSGQEPPEASSGSPPAPPAPPPQPASGGPGSPSAAAPQREGFWGVVWRTATRSVIVATVGSITFVVVMLVSLFALVAILGVVFAGDDDDGRLETEFVYGVRGAHDKLLVVRVDGVILGEKLDEPLFSSGYAYGYEVKEILQKAAADDDIRGVLLWLSTPGGTIYGSRAIADGVAEYQRETGNPVVAYVAGVSASGGTYAMSGADLVLADHGSIVGSIGVIFGPFTFYDGVIATEGGIFGGGVTTTDGINVDYVTAGRGKDVGNPFRPMTAEERAVLQEGVDDEYDAFVDHVAEHRGIAPAVIRDEIGAMIYGNARARELGLIDGTATLEEAYEQLAERAGVRLGYQVIEESGSGSLFGALVQAGADAESLATLASAEGVCLARGTYLAYWGDPSALCWR